MYKTALEMIKGSVNRNNREVHIEEIKDSVSSLFNLNGDMYTDNIINNTVCQVTQDLCIGKKDIKNVYIKNLFDSGEDLSDLSVFKDVIFVYSEKDGEDIEFVSNKDLNKSIYKESSSIDTNTNIKNEYNIDVNKDLILNNIISNSKDSILSTDIVINKFYSTVDKMKDVLIENQFTDLELEYLRKNNLSEYNKYIRIIKLLIDED